MEIKYSDICEIVKGSGLYFKLVIEGYMAVVYYKPYPDFGDGYSLWKNN